ncbi:hypothetical protein [Bacteroides ihuae]|nr:hypothetical protein [Bacteroides ihuae]
MKKKEVTLELVHDILTLIKLQEYSLKNMKRAIRNPKVLDFQEDILRVLK